MNDKQLNGKLLRLARDPKNKPPQSWYDSPVNPFYPNETPDLLQRCTTALDFLVVMRKSDGSFVQSIVNNKIVDEPYVLVYHLQAVSLLLSCGKVFVREDWTKIAEDAFFYAMEHHFLHGDNACLIDDDESLTLANALMAVIHYKMGEDATTYMNTLKECVCDDNVDRFYPPGTLVMDPKAAAPLGAVILAFFEAYKHTRESEYLEYAHKVGELMPAKARMDSYDIWALRLLHDSVDETKFKGTALHLVNSMNNIAMASMSAFTASIAQRANIAWADVQPDYREKIRELLEFQKTTQSSERYKGAFTKTKEISDIHISYFVYNILSFMEYLVFIEDQKHLEIARI